jgi:beta-lactamase regulating signal transducer with metallopeptidase domain
METIADIFQAGIIQRLGWTLVHFVWQGGAVGLILAIVLKLLNKSSANLRYTIACMALVLIVVMPAVTIRMVAVSVEAIEPIKQAAIDLPKAGMETQAIAEIPQVEPRPAPVAASPRVSLKDRFIEIVEPALPFIVAGWLVGVFGLSLWHLGGWRQLQRLRRQMVKQVPALKAKLQQLSNMLGIRKAVGLMESALVQVPTVVGHLKPVILLPASALTGLSSEQIEAILAHELAHIKRCDYLVNMLQTVVEILGFYHPAVWWVSHKIRVERENCCDDIAVSVCSDRVCYAKALTTMEEIRGRQPALAVAASGGSLFDRIRRLLGKEGKDEAKLSWAPSVIAMLLTISFLIPISFAMSSRGKTNSNLPDFVIKGMVTDAETGQPIAGAKIGDVERYAEGKQWATTDVNGNYEYKTWYEEHGVKAEADGYRRQDKGFGTKLFGSEKEKVIDFALQKQQDENSESSVVPQKFVGRWSGRSKIIVNWTRQRWLPIDIEIKPDGTVTGQVGDSELRDGVFRLRDWFTRLFNPDSKMIRGNLSGAIIKNEGIEREYINLLVHNDLSDGKIIGGFHTSGWHIGGKKTMVMSGTEMVLEKVSAKTSDIEQKTDVQVKGFKRRLEEPITDDLDEDGLYLDKGKLQILIDCYICQVSNKALDEETVLKMKSLLGENKTPLDLESGISLLDGKIFQDITNNGIGGKQFDGLLELLSSRGYLNLKARPKMLTMDAEAGTVESANGETFISGYSEPNEPGGEPLPKYDTLKTIDMKILPKLDKDKKNIMLDIDLIYSPLIRFEERTYKEKYPYKIPMLDMSSVKTRLLIPSGQVIIAGEGGGRLIFFKAEKLEPGTPPLDD